MGGTSGRQGVGESVTPFLNICAPLPPTCLALVKAFPTSGSIPSIELGHGSENR